jgi:hypothetical protein
MERSTSKILSLALRGLFFWMVILWRALKQGATRTILMILITLPWLIYEYVILKVKPESHQEKINPFVYTMQ